MVNDCQGYSLDDTIPPLNEPNGTTATTNLEKAELIASHFSGKMQVPDPQKQPPVLPRMTNDSLKTFIVNEEVVFQVLSSLEEDKAIGPDKISPRVLRRCATELTKPLTSIFNTCIALGKWPSSWKVASVVPVHKKKSKSEVSNYRPISLLSVVAKALETIISKNITDFFDKHMLLNDRQYGFRKGRSASDLLLNLSSKWNQALDDGDNCFVIALDIAGAFDRVWHQGLLTKLQALGLCDNALALIGDYLLERSLQVVIHGVNSSTHKIGASVPQGSVLGPLLWNVYFNDLLNLVPESHAYADDCTLTIRYKTEERASAVTTTNQHLSNISRWGEIWQVSFAPEKTQAMEVTRHHNLPNEMGLVLGTQELHREESIEILGVKFDSKMTMVAHVQDLAKRAAKKLTALRRIARFLDSGSCKILYNAQVRSHLEYAPLSWQGCPPSHLRLLDKVEERACRLIASLEAGQVRQQMHQTLQHRRDVAALTVLYKANVKKITHLQPLQVQKGERVRNTRNSLINSWPLVVPFSRTALHQRSFISRATRIWNRFAQEHSIPSITTTEEMKILAHNWLLTANPVLPNG